MDAVNDPISGDTAAGVPAAGHLPLRNQAAPGREPESVVLFVSRGATLHFVCVAMKPSARCWESCVAFVVDPGMPEIVCYPTSGAPSTNFPLAAPEVSGAEGTEGT